MQDFQGEKLKSCIQETLNLLTCGDSSSDTKINRKGQEGGNKKKKVSRVTCHLSLKRTATPTDPHPVASSTLHSRLVFKDPKKMSMPTKSLKEQKNKKKRLEVCQY